MRVGVNLTWLRPGQVGGSEEYLTRLLRAIDQTRPGAVELTLFVLPSFAEAHPDLADAHTVVTCPISGESRGLRVGAEVTWLPDAARKSGVDIVHHGGGTVAATPPPALLHVHDVQYLVRPDTFSPIKLRFLRRAMPRSLARATAVACPSEYVRRTLIEGLGALPDTVVVVPHVLPDLGPITDPEEVKARYGLDRPWFVYPAITYAHKNHATAVRALAKVDDALLVLTGGEAAAERFVRDQVAHLGLGDRVRRVGRIPAPDLRAIVQGAVATVFPSAFEGFGAPVLEAMALDCPVVAADATAVPEVVGDAGLLVRPYDVDGWAAAMSRLLGDPAERARLIAAGRQRLGHYPPEAAADALLAAYAKTAAGR